MQTALSITTATRASPPAQMLPSLRKPTPTPGEDVITSPQMPLFKAKTSLSE